MKLNYLFYSSFPFFISIIFFNLILSFVFFLYFGFGYFFLKFCFSSLSFLIYNWFFDLYLESKMGLINVFIKDFLKYGFLLFIFSELMFFFSIFWFFFDLSLNQMMEIFESWTPQGVILINPFSMPLMNTFILLSSGFSITVFHMNLMKNKKDVLSMFMTIFLAILFLLIQFMEYNEMFFSLKESAFSSIFFFSTGFHGLHVLFGLFFILINFVRFMKNDFFMKNMLSLEFSIIYWHFVDVVWLFLFIFVYWWTF